MKKTIGFFVILLFFLIAAAVCSYAESGNAGKLYIFSKDPEAKIHLDGVLVGKANAWIEAIAEGKYKMVVMGGDGNLILAKEADIKAGETTILVVEEELAKIQPKGKKADVSDLTPSFTLYIGYHSLGLTLNNVNYDLTTYGLSPAGFGIEANKNITKNLELQIGVSGYFAKTGTAGGSSDYFYAWPLHFNIRNAWELNNIFQSFYVGGGTNLTVFQFELSGTQESYATGGTNPLSSGYQFFIGGYSGAWGYSGNLNVELGYINTASNVLKRGAGAGSLPVSAKGVYLKVGLAF